MGEHGVIAFEGGEHVDIAAQNGELVGIEIAGPTARLAAHGDGVLGVPAGHRLQTRCGTFQLALPVRVHLVGGLHLVQFLGELVLRECQCVRPGDQGQ